MRTPIARPKAFHWLTAGLVAWQLLACNQQPEPAGQAQPSFEIVAHRGANKLAPENTRAAIQKAIELGLDYVEVDARTTIDGELILMHDGTVDRTTNGAGAVADLTLARIRKLDAGSWFDPDFTGARVPLFSEALAQMAGKIGVYVDLKRADPRQVVAALDSAGMLEAAVLYSGDYEELARYRRLDARCRVMPEVESTRRLAQAMVKLHPAEIAMVWRNFTPELIAEAHAAGVRVFLDVVGDARVTARSRQALTAGVDVIQTDHPDSLLSLKTDTP